MVTQLQCTEGQQSRIEPIAGHFARQRIGHCSSAINNYALADGPVENRSALVTEAELKRPGDDLVFFK